MIFKDVMDLLNPYEGKGVVMINSIGARANLMAKKLAVRAQTEFCLREEKYHSL